MDLRSVLNDEGGDASNRRRYASTGSASSPGPAQQLPTLTTNMSSFSASSQSPTMQHYPPHPQPQNAPYAYSTPNPLYAASPHNTPAQYTPVVPPSPYTPGNPHPQLGHHHFNQRPPSHPSMASTPTSTYNQSPPPVRASPAHARPPSQHGASYSPRYESHPPISRNGPPMPQRPPSQEMLVHPLGNVPIPRPAAEFARPPSGPYAAPPPQIPPQNSIRGPPQMKSPSSGPYMARQTPPERADMTPASRSRSISVSPKTVVTNLPTERSSSASSATQFPHAEAPDHKRIEPQNEQHRNSQYQALGPPPALDQTKDRSNAAWTDSPPSDHMRPPTQSRSFNKSHRASTDGNDVGQMLKSSQSPAPLASGPDSTPPSRGTPTTDLTERKAIPEKRSVTPAEPVSANLKRVHTPDSMTEARAVQPLVKRQRRFREPPIWAQQAKHTNPLRKDPTQARKLAANNAASARSTPPQGANQIPNGVGSSKPSVAQQMPSQIPSQTPSQVPSQVPRIPSQTPSLAPGPAEPNNEGPLGPWEACFTGIIPYEDMTRRISDFLFVNVVQQHGLATGAAGGVPSIHGQLEIEARLGRIIDKNTGQRMYAPVKSETIMDSSPHFAFESSMTQMQHEQFNNFLNDSFQTSVARIAASSRDPAAKARLQMQYKHTKEQDSFYRLPEEEISSLPPAMKDILSRHPSRRPRLRVTRDQKTGQVLAKIIKAQLNDILVYSPNTQFDWRISVNVEMNWDGDEKALAGGSAGDGPAGDTAQRNKDRISYRHIFCQIDLTQVKSSSAMGVGDEVHELEVELDSTAVREQGLLAAEGKPSQYEDLVKGFADNVRVLARLLS